MFARRKNLLFRYVAAALLAAHLPLAAAQEPPPQPPAAPKEFPGIPWRSFLLFPELVVGLTYDDNIYARRREPTRDWVYTVSPLLKVNSKWDRHALNFELGVDADRYRDQSAEDVTDHRVGFDGRYDLGALTNVFGGARFVRDHEDRSASGALTVFQQAKPTVFYRQELHLGFATGAGPWRLRAGGTYEDYDYKDGVSAVGTPIDSDFRDRLARSFGARVSYVISQGNEVFGQYATDVRDYRNDIAGQSFNRDSRGYRAAVGLRYALRHPELRGEILAGVLRQKFEHGGFADVSVPYYGASLTWQPTPRTSVTGFVDRSLEETTVFQDGVFASGSLDTTYGFSVEQKLTSALTLSARAAYTRSAFQGIDRLETIADAAAGLRYYFTRSLFLGAELRLIDRNSGVLDAQYSRNQFLLSLGYTPARSNNYSLAPGPDATAALDRPSLYPGFHAGGDFGHGVLTTRTSGPRGSGGLDRGDMGNFGESLAFVAGWGTVLGNWYFGIEGEGGASSTGWSHRKAKDDSRTMQVKEDASYGLSVRLGYLLEGGLLYGTLGLARADLRSQYAENQFGAGGLDREHFETGVRWGVGLEMPSTSSVFVRMRYSHTAFDAYDVPYQSAVSAITTEQFDLRKDLFSVGIGWRFGAERAPLVDRAPETLRGLYAGAGGGHGALGTLLTGTHRDQGLGPFDFTGDFADSGGGVGFFAGYGHTFGQFYLGAEFEVEAANLGWHHERQTGGGGGRDFAVEKRGGYGAALRFGYALPNGGLIYGRIGPMRTRFNTIYNKGASTDQWIDRTDRLDGVRVGIGAEAPAARSMFVRFDYTYTSYDSYAFTTAHGGGANADGMAFRNRENLFRLGLGFRF